MRTGLPILRIITVSYLPYLHHLQVALDGFYYRYNWGRRNEGRVLSQPIYKIRRVKNVRISEENWRLFMTFESRIKTTKG